MPPCGRRGNCRAAAALLWGGGWDPCPTGAGTQRLPCLWTEGWSEKGSSPRGFSAHLHLLSRPERAARGPHLQRQWPCQDQTPGTCPVARAQDSAGVLAWGLPALTAGEPGQPGATPAQSPSPPRPLPPFLPRAPPRGPCMKNTPEDGHPVKSSPGRRLALLLWLGLWHRGPWARVAACQVHLLRIESLSVSRITPGSCHDVSQDGLAQVSMRRVSPLGPWAPPQEPSQ